MEEVCQWLNERHYGDYVSYVKKTRVLKSTDAVMLMVILRGVQHQRLNLGSLGNEALQHPLPLSPNWLLGGPDKFRGQPASTWPLGPTNTVPYANQFNQAIVPKGWRMVTGSVPVVSTIILPEQSAKNAMLLCLEVITKHIFFDSFLDAVCF